MMIDERPEIDTNEPVAVSRKFGILDGMILIAVTAIGLAWNRWSMADYFLYNSPFDQASPLVKHFNLAMWNILPHLVSWSLAVVLLGLRRPRGPVRELVRRPGAAACWAASLVALFQTAWYVPFKIGHPGGVRPGILLMHYFESASFAVAGAWLILSIGCLWSVEKNWLDRMGRVLGTAWIVLMVFFHFRQLLL